LGERKAHTVKGSVKSWPVGLRLRIVPERLREFAVVLVEGGPDLMAAYAVLARLPMGARDVHPVALLGTSATIAPDALGAMSGRVVVILAHGDDPGREAGRRWGKQLSGAGCRVTVRKLPEGKDLSDLLTERAPADLAGLITPPQL
jgi:predicted nuclease with TOPRIM domain